MESGKTGYIEFSSNTSWATVRVNWAETYDTETNKSTVTITSVQVKSTSWYGVTYYVDGTVKINGVAVATFSSSAGNVSVRVDDQGTWYDVMSHDTSKAVTMSLDGIEHYSDGSKSIGIELTGNRYTGFRFYTVDGTKGSGWYVDASKSITLTTIPRASTVGASDANIGSKSTVVVTRRNSSYTHSIAYSFGSLSGYITASGGVSDTEAIYSNTTISWTIPETFYSQITDKKSGTCTLTIKTYSGSTQIGDAQSSTLKIGAAQSASAPDVSGSVVDSNDTTKVLTGDASKFIRYFSTALCTITATAKGGATIATKKIGGAVVTENTRSIKNVEVSSIAFYAKDSRGYEATKNVAITLIPYVLLTNNATAQRTDPVSGIAKLTIKGDYFNGSFGASGNALTIKYRVRESGGSYGSYNTATPSISGNAYTANVSLADLHYESGYEIEVVVSDKLGTVTKVVYVQPGIPVFDWGKRDFRFNVPVYLASGINSNPVSVSSFDSIDASLNSALQSLEDNGVGFPCFQIGGVLWHCILFKTSNNYATAEFYSHNGRKRKALIGGTWGALTAENEDKFQPMTQDAYESLIASGADDPTAFYLIVGG